MAFYVERKQLQLTLALRSGGIFLSEKIHFHEESFILAENSVPFDRQLRKAVKRQSV